MTTIKELGDIRRNEWIAYTWIEVTENADATRRFLRGKMRTPDEGARAARDWDLWIPSARIEFRKLNGASL
jgi:hypothetical protein